jgi:hypothetical protein
MEMAELWEGVSIMGYESAMRNVYNALFLSMYLRE